MTDDRGIPQIPTPDELVELDAAKRMAEAVNLHVLAARAGGPRDRPAFVAIRLEDGRSPDDGVLYDSRADAVRHNRNNPYVFYVKVGRDTMPVREALIVLKLARQAYNRGVVFAEEEVVTPHMTELIRRVDLRHRRPLKGLPE